VGGGGTSGGKQEGRRRWKEMGMTGEEGAEWIRRRRGKKEKGEKKRRGEKKGKENKRKKVEMVI
jgi:hypothetical protein